MRTLVRLCCALACACALSFIFLSATANAQGRGARSVAPPPPSPPVESTLDSIPSPLLALIQQQRLQASDAAASDSFGNAVSLSSDGNTALIGSVQDANSGGQLAGSAYVFTRSGTVWSQRQRLQASDAAAADQFGTSVALSSDGNTLLIGANADNNSGGTDAGSAYTFVVVPPATAGQVIISEFRVNGPGGDSDRFVELYNTTNSTLSLGDYVVTFLMHDGNGASGQPLPTNTLIAPHGHYLFVTNGYTLSAYASSDNSNPAAFPSIKGGVGLFNSGSLSAASRIDSVLFSDTQAGILTEAFREGTPLPQTGDSTVEHAWVRDTSTGKPKDTDNNAADFRLVSTTAASIGGVPSTLGAPGPENSTSPIERTAQMPLTLVASCVSSTSAPNRVRDLTSDPANNSQFGTLKIRRTVTNNTGASVTRLRFRAVIITAGPAPSGTADLRIRSSVADTFTNSCAGGPTASQGVTLEQPPNQTAGGGLNSSLSLAGVTTAPVTNEVTVGDEDSPVLLGAPTTNDTITLDAPLANGSSVTVNFLLGIQQTGNFRFYVIVEALP